MLLRPRSARIPGLLAGAVLLAGCSAANPPAEEADGTVSVIASAYPMQFLVERVGGGHVQVTNLTPPGAEPHDLELSPQAVAQVQDADLLVYSAGLQAAVDDVAEQHPSTHVLDVSASAHLETTGEEEHATDEHATDEHATDGHDDHAHDDHGHSHDGVDPHFWLDPVRYGEVGHAVADELAAIDPEHAADYEANADQLTADLTALDAELASGLSGCRQHAVVVSHEAYGYLTSRYGFEQVPITGIQPEAEPTPAQLAEVARIVRASGVRTIYSEPLLGDTVSRVIAAETGAQVLTLDPIEGLSDASAGSDYFALMRANLAALRTGQECS